MNLVADIIVYIVVDIILHKLIFPKSILKGIMAWLLLFATLYLGYIFAIFMAQSGFIPRCVQGVDMFCIQFSQKS